MNAQRLKADKRKSPKTVAYPKGTGRRRVYDLIRSRILDLTFWPGEDMDETRLVATLGVSRTLVREALIRLGAEGLVVLLPNRGARVAPIDATNLREFFEALDLCQRATAHWAALRHTPEDLLRIHRHMSLFEKAVQARHFQSVVEENREFHAAIAACSGNVHITDAYDRLLTEGLRLSRIAYSHELENDVSIDEKLNHIVAEHRELAERIEARDADNAEVVAGRHAERSRQRIMGMLTTVRSGVRIPTMA